MFLGIPGLLLLPFDPQDEKHRFHVPDVLNERRRRSRSIGEEHHHAARVVRVREGEEVEVFDGAETTLSLRGRVTTKRSRSLARAPVNRAKPATALHLACPSSSSRSSNSCCRKATELGVRSIIPLVTDRIEIRAERYRGKAERWQKIVFEAVKQSGRSVDPGRRRAASAVRRGHQARRERRSSSTPTPNRRPGSPAMPRRSSSARRAAGSERELALAREHGCDVRAARTAPACARRPPRSSRCAIVAARSGDI